MGENKKYLRNVKKYHSNQWNISECTIVKHSVNQFDFDYWICVCVSMGGNEVNSGKIQIIFSASN